MGGMLITLLSEALHEGKAAHLPDEAELSRLLAEANRHGVSAVLCQALPERVSPCVQQMEAKIHAVDMAQEYEGAALLKRMAEGDIPCIPLKGWVLRNAYPRPYMRTMGDLDLLIHSEQLPDVDQVMIELGYVRERDHFTDYHVCYSKPPCLTVEVHIRLAEEDSCPVFETVWERTAVTEKGFYQLCDEDSYLFMVYHGAKHALLGGIGLRYIMDMWVFLRRLSRNALPIRREMVSEGLNRLGLTSFAAYSEKLAAEWFGEMGTSLSTAMLDIETMRLWREYVLTSGAFGGVVSSYENQLAGSSAPALATAKIFPCRAQMEIRYPELRQKPWMLPKFWVVRLWEKLRRGEALHGALALTSVTRKTCDNREYLLTHLGLL